MSANPVASPIENMWQQCHYQTMDFDALANQHKDAVYRQMVRVCGNREDAEDVLIEALLNAYRHMDALRDHVAFRAWLATIARRVCWRLKKEEALAPLLQLSAIEEEGHDIASPQPAPDVEAVAGQMKAIMAAALASLPNADRQVYQLRDVEQLSGAETARRLDISLAAMKSRLHRARRHLRARLDQALTRSK